MSVQLISIIVSLLFILQVMYFTSKHKLKDQQAFLWLIIAISSLIIALAIPVFNRLATFIGVSYMPSLIFLLAFLIIISIVLYQTTILSNQQEKIKNLVQELAFLKKEIQDNAKSDNSRSASNDIQ